MPPRELILTKTSGKWRLTTLGRYAVYALATLTLVGIQLRKPLLPAYSRSYTANMALLNAFNSSRAFPFPYEAYFPQAYALFEFDEYYIMVSGASVEAVKRTAPGLRVRGKKVRNLEWTRSIWLTALHLVETDVEDLGPLRRQPWLETLVLRRNPRVSLNALPRLASLTTLEIYVADDSPPLDLKPLAECPTLRRLCIHSVANVRNISLLPLDTLQELEIDALPDDPAFIERCASAPCTVVLKGKRE